MASYYMKKVGLTRNKFFPDDHVLFEEDVLAAVELGLVLVSHVEEAVHANLP